MSKAFRFYAFDGESESVTVAIVFASSADEAYRRGWATLPASKACEILERLDAGGDDESEPSYFTISELDSPEAFEDALQDYVDFRLSRSTIV
jgi:hypothetical protein